MKKLMYALILTGMFVQPVSAMDRFNSGNSQTEKTELEQALEKIEKLERKNRELQSKVGNQSLSLSDVSLGSVSIAMKIAIMLLSASEKQADNYSQPIQDVFTNMLSGLEKSVLDTLPGVISDTLNKILLGDFLKNDEILGGLVGDVGRRLLNKGMIDFAKGSSKNIVKDLVEKFGLKNTFVDSVKVASLCSLIGDRQTLQSELGLGSDDDELKRFWNAVEDNTCRIQNRLSNNYTSLPQDHFEEIQENDSEERVEDDAEVVSSPVSLIEFLAVCSVEEGVFKRALEMTAGHVGNTAPEGWAFIWETLIDSDRRHDQRRNRYVIPRYQDCVRRFGNKK